MLPVMLTLNIIMDLILTDLKTGCNVISKEQANYNSEIGLADALKRYSSLSYSDFRVSIYYLNFDNNTLQFSMTEPHDYNYVKVLISYANNGTNNRLYSIDSIGHFDGCVKEIVKNIPL